MQVQAAAAAAAPPATLPVAGDAWPRPRLRVLAPAHMAVQQEQLDGIKKLFGIFLLGVKFGVGRQEQSGYMGGRRDQCSKNFCSMLGVRAKMILVPCVVFEPGVGEDRRLVKPQYFSRARKWEVCGIGKLVGDSFSAQSKIMTYRRVVFRRVKSAALDTVW